MLSSSSSWFLRCRIKLNLKFLLSCRGKVQEWMRDKQARSQWITSEWSHTYQCEPGWAETTGHLGVFCFPVPQNTQVSRPATALRVKGSTLYVVRWRDSDKGEQVKGVDEDAQVRCLVRLCCPYLISCTIASSQFCFFKWFLCACELMCIQAKCHIHRVLLLTYRSWLSISIMFGARQVAVFTGTPGFVWKDTVWCNTLF